MTLTIKREKFAQAVADGMSQADAYRAAYAVRTETKVETIHKRASELMADGEVAGRVAELRAALAEKALWTREMSVKALVQSYRVAQETRNASGMTGAIKELNAMHGFNAPTQLHVTARQLPASVNEFV